MRSGSEYQTFFTCVGEAEHKINVWQMDGGWMGGVGGVGWVGWMGGWVDAKCVYVCMYQWLTTYDALPNALVLVRSCDLSYSYE